MNEFDMLTEKLIGYFQDFSYEEGIRDMRRHYIGHRFARTPFYSQLKSELEYSLKLDPLDFNDKERITHLVHYSAGKPQKNVTLQKQWLQKLYDDLFGYIESLSEEELEAKYYEYNPKKKSMLTKLKNLFTKN